MTPTIYQQENGPWEQGGRQVESFRSGLLKFTQDYKVKTSSADADSPLIGATMDSTNTRAIDGVYIYPEPQRRDDGDGFSTVRVTGYGRSKQENDFTVETRLVAKTMATTILVDGEFSSSQSTPYTGVEFVCRYVLASSSTDIIPEFGDLLYQDRLYDINGRGFSPYRYEVPDGFISAGMSVTKTPVIGTLDSSYFGQWTEIALVVGYSISRTINLETIEE